MVDMAALKVANTDRWASAKLTRNFVTVAKALIAAKSVYTEVQRVTKVPWWFIAVVHERESNQDWMASLAQGDPWNAVSTHVPVGRGPFHSWQAAAIDALVYCPPYAANNRDWSVGGTLTLLEEYNGLGYASGPVTKQNGVVIARYPPQASPYVWSGTDQYIKGKYPHDHYFDPDVIDVQMGCAGLLLTMANLDSSVKIGLPAMPTVATPTVVEPVQVAVKDPPKDSAFGWVKSWFT